MEGGGEVKNFNPNKRIAEELVLEVLLKHRDAVFQSNFGIRPGEDPKLIKDKDRIINQCAALRDMIGSQKMIIDIVSKSTIEKNCQARWRKKYKTDEERNKNPFKEEKNDLTELMFWRDFVKECHSRLIKADETPTLDDDFMISRINHTGDEENHLTKNFYEMYDDLMESYSKIYGLMITNKIVSSGLEENEELSYKEQEDELIRRVVEA